MLRHYPDRVRLDEIPPQSRRAAAIQYHETAGTLLYAARFQDGTIKIGCTGRIDVRLSHLKAVDGQTPEVLAIRRGTFAEEKALHESLAAHRAHDREWYHPHPEVLAIVNEWREELGRDPLPLVA